MYFTENVRIKEQVRILCDTKFISRAVARFLDGISTPEGIQGDMKSPDIYITNYYSGEEESIVKCPLTDYSCNLH